MNQRTPHLWTDAEKDYLRVHYRYTGESLQELASTFNVTENAVRHQLAWLRLVKSVVLRWSSEDEEYLREHYSSQSPLRIARHLGRSLSVVVSKAHRLGVAQRGRGRDNWFTMRDVTEILGVDSSWITRRLQNGFRLERYAHSPGSAPGRNGNAAWHISEASLRDFIRRYPEELTGRNVDFVMLVDILAGVRESIRGER